MDIGTPEAQTVNGTPVAAAIAGKEYERPGYSLFVWISDNKLECRCSYVPGTVGSMMSLDELRGFLAESGVKEGIDEDALKDFAIKASTATGLNMVLLASGTSPVNGVDGWISYSVQPTVTVQDVIDDDSTMDMHQVQSFMNVVPGEDICRVMPPEPGSPGMNVIGVVLPPQPGKALNLKVGKNIRCDGDGSLLVATAAGRVCQASGEISVEEEYVVSGNVDFRVGSITFNGFVEVRGDVLDDFNVTATRGMSISGNVGVCAIRSDGDITFCGMDGQGRGSIVCNGTIRANFIHDCHVECAGDVIVDVEVHNCTIKSLGRIIVNKGAISGGSYTALGGIDAKKIGSPASVRAKLAVGVDYHDAEELERLFAGLEKNQTQIAQTESLPEIEELRKVRAGLTDRILAIRAKTDQRSNAKINVQRMLYENILLSIGTVNEETKEQLDGPVSIIENTIEGGLRYLQVTSLDVKAKDIELAFVKEQNL